MWAFASLEYVGLWLGLAMGLAPATPPLLASFKQTRPALPLAC